MSVQSAHQEAERCVVINTSKIKIKTCKTYDRVRPLVFSDSSYTEEETIQEIRAVSGLARPGSRVEGGAVISSQITFTRVIHKTNVTSSNGPT